MAADWDKIKAEYIAGGITYRELADKYNVSMDVIMKKAAKDKWRASRQKACRKTAEKIAEKISAKQAKAAVDELEVARYTTMIWQDTLRDIAELIGEHKEVYAGDLSELAAMSNAINKNIDSLYKSCRLISATEARRLEIEEKRIALEQKKFEAEQKEKKQDTGGVKVVMELPEGVDFG